MNTSEYCNNDLYMGLNALFNNPKRTYRIILPDEHTYTQAVISDTSNQITLSDSLGNSISMDINCFVELQRRGQIKFYVQ